MGMTIKTKVVKLTSSSPVEILQATNKTIIKTFSIVLRSDGEFRTISVYIKEDSSSEAGALIYKKAVTKEGLYMTDLFLDTNNILIVECPDYSSGDKIDIILQYIELT